MVGRGPVEAETKGSYDPLDRRNDCRVVGEHDVGPNQFSVPLDIHTVGGIDEDIGDGRVSEEFLQRTQTHQPVYDLLEKRLARHRSFSRRQPSDRGTQVLAVEGHRGVDEGSGQAVGQGHGSSQT
jgi:hypothetical protein